MSIQSSRRDVIKDITLGAGATLLSPVLLQLAAHARGDASAIRKRIVFVIIAMHFLSGYGQSQKFKVVLDAGHGGKDYGAPALRPHYHAHYYAAFVIDPEGNNIEAVCHLPE